MEPHGIRAGLLHLWMCFPYSQVAAVLSVDPVMGLIVFLDLKIHKEKGHIILVFDVQQS